LCHGDMGNLDLLFSAGHILADPAWRAQADRLAAIILDSIERAGWQCGGPEGVELPGLMLGLAGIGYEMLRLAEPEQVPSVLALSPPARPKGQPNATPGAIAVPEAGPAARPKPAKSKPHKPVAP
ncbi:MAG TPA: lanthionine synthetase LanC family protein, partial [Caldilineaceae bacterium]|nr:lanthionine synthetase LanC family protein [Caldilineaceae bacterium]